MTTEQVCNPPPPPSLPPPPQNWSKSVGFTKWTEVPIGDYISKHWNRLTNDDDSMHVVSTFCTLNPVIQNGPQCGIVALSMATQLLKASVTVDRICQEAQILKFTAKGEMFSVENMKVLAETVLGTCDAQVLHSSSSAPGQIIMHLLQGKPLLVPYDSDHNFEPCMRNGQSAHWAVLHGTLLAEPYQWGHERALNSKSWQGF
ncbi:actin maturation protease-like isoform X2 [Ornithodoros turicata]|uniref:actin maturation protease-like isoform X2 n=1 Tax=Ornithodoros turicata TaxID=34597 RepID=UPI00313A2C04